MTYLLRLFVYNQSNRSMYSTLEEGKRVDQHPSLGYGTSFSYNGQEYVVADLPRMKSIPDPTNPDGDIMQYDVYLARVEEWGLFEQPRYVAELLNRK